jgi:porphobilinogen synthase
VPTSRKSFPVRLRRLRRSYALRRLVAENTLELSRLIYPIFVHPGSRGSEPVPSLPGVARHNPLDAAKIAFATSTEKLGGVLLFGLARKKDPLGSDAWSARAAVPECIRAIKAASKDVVVITDVCLCSYTTHGHCGVFEGGAVDNDRSLELLGRVAVSHARAGADMVAPSAMMDHQVRAIRTALDEAGFRDTAILSYAAKLASAFYGPFREAADSAPKTGNRLGYQLDPRNAREAMREMSLDAEEGADALMVKPALPCLDLIARARERFDLPLAAYQVSGEYAMIKAAASRGWLDEQAAIEESLHAIRRAGADWIVTYFARQVAAQRPGET